MLSHGSGSSPLVNRELALSLARAGFCVGMPVHPGDNRDDRSLQDARQNLQQRPRHLQLAIDALVQDDQRFLEAKPEGIALIGHSLGAYTALALAGGEPRTLPDVWPDGPTAAIPVVHDPRVSALVLLAPAAVWFHGLGSLDAVHVPVLMLGGEHDTITPPAQHADLVAGRLPHPDLLDYRIVDGAGHYAFLSVFPPQMQQPGFLPAQDPPGFDRSVFQGVLAETIITFLRNPAASVRGSRGCTPLGPASGPLGD